MGEFRKKSELGFFFLWIWIYLMAQSGGELLSRIAGIRYSGTALLNVLLAGFLLLWLRREKLLEYYGLNPMKTAPEGFIWLLPLAVISTHNLWSGTAWNLPLSETVFCVVTMVCAGLLEELLMRGFLFQYLKKRDLRTAVVVSTLVFGGAHGLNLRELGPAANLLQVAGALAFGLLCALILLRCGNLRPCILAHCTINVLSVFGAETGPVRMILLSALHLALMLAYAAFLIRTPKHLK